MKQESDLNYLSSSSRRYNSSPATKNVDAKNIGCMSAFLRLLSKYNHNRRRFLTFGKNPERKNFDEKFNQSPKPSGSFSQNQNGNLKEVQQLSSGSVPRSPTLPPEIRRSNSSQTPQLTVVARLMGLDSEVAAEVEEKRRRLVGALEKCDEDLKELKRIIEMVKRVSSGDENGDVYGCDGSKWRSLGGRKGELEASPVSVFDEFTRSPFSGYSKRCINGGRVPQKQKKKPGDKEDLINMSFIDKITSEMILKAVKSSSNYYYYGSHDDDENNPNNWSLWKSKGMVESVDEVCRDIAWGERRETGRIGLALQDFICKDLIEELVFDLGLSSLPSFHPLPFESCKKRLSF